MFLFEGIKAQQKGTRVKIVFHIKILYLLTHCQAVQK